MLIAPLKRNHHTNLQTAYTSEALSLLNSSFPSSLFELVLGSGGWLSFLRCWGNLVQFHEFGEIELWLLEDLDLSDHAVVLEWEDFRGVFLNLFSDFLFN